MNLVTMADFVLQQSEKKGEYIDYREFLEESHKMFIAYANLLQTELVLGMFLPCDKENNLLNEKTTDSLLYEEAKSRILFKNVNFNEYQHDSEIRLYKVNDVQVFNISNGGKHLYWQVYDIENITKELDYTIEFVDTFNLMDYYER